MSSILTTLIVIGIIVLAIFIGVKIIKYKISKATRKYLGMGLDETAKLIKKGLEEENTRPRSISNTAPLHKPKFQRDFPETSYDQIEKMACGALTGYLSAITAGSVEKLYAPSRNLVQQAQSRIDDNISRNVKEKFENVRIHKASMSDYQSRDGVADAFFEIAFEAVHGGDKPEQLACRVVLNSGRAEADDTSSAVFSSTCPNCGAPLKIAGKNTVCSYCGTGVSERGTRVWLADSIKFI